MKTNTRGRQATSTPITEEAKPIVEDAIAKFREENQLSSDKVVAKMLNVSHSTFDRFRKGEPGVSQSYAEDICRGLELNPAVILDYTFKQRIYTYKGNPNRLTTSSRGACLEAVFLLMGDLNPKKMNTFTALLNGHLTRLVIKGSLNVTPKSIQLPLNDYLCIVGGKVAYIDYEQVELVLKEMKDCFQAGTGKFNLTPCKV
jgi:hypothetical protein